MQEVGQRPSDPKQWATGTSAWGQKSPNSDVDWTPGTVVSSAGLAAGSGKTLWSSLKETDNAPEQGSTSKSEAATVTSSSANLQNPDKSQNSNAMSNLSASISWGPNPSSTGLESSLWGAVSTAASTNSTWGSSTTPVNQGHNMQIGASSVGDNQSSNGSASAGGWGVSSISQSESSLSGMHTQSQSGSMPSSSLGQQSGPSLASSQGMGSLGTAAMPWQNSKPFGMRDFAQTSDSSWSSLPSTAVSSSGNNPNKEDSNNTTGSLTEPGKMELAVGLANLSIDKTAPPPDLNRNAMKGGWNGSMEPGKLPVGAVGNTADLSFAQAAQKRRKTPVGGLGTGVLSPKEEEIRRAINSNEGWGTRPVRQDTSWDMESSPKLSRKVAAAAAENPEVAPSNMWNNNNGTDIWLTSRDSTAPRWVGGAAAGGNVFPDKDPGAWNMPPKPNMDGSSWAGNMAGNMAGNNAMNPMGSNPVSDKNIGTWGGESQQASSSKQWGPKTETGSWNEPPQDRSNMTWGGQDTEVGTWEDPATATARRIVSSSGVGPVGMGGGGGGMNMGNSNMSVGGSNMPMGSGNMVMGGSMGMSMPGNGMGGNNMNMGMGGASNMGMGGTGNMGMGGSGNMGMGGGGNMGMGGGGNMGMGGGGNMGMGGGGNMGMGGGGSMGMGGSGNMGMGGGGNMGMGGGGNMGMGGGGGNMGMGGVGNMNMPMAGGNLGMGGSANMNMPMGGNMTVGGGSGMGISGSGDMYWNDPNSKPQGWNPAAGPPRPKVDEQWSKPGMGQPGGNNGWGEPSGGSAIQKGADDGTSIWAANAQEQARAAGWGEPGAMWNPAFGARPKATSWTGGDPDNWQRKLGQQRFTGSGGQPQMRIKLLQQLMDMGFKKEEAQNALISNNMNFESALGELTSGLHDKKDMENDVFQTGGAKMLRQGFMSDGPGMMGEDISDNRADNNPHVPNFPMQNAPFNNAQVPNQSFMSGGINMYDPSKAGPPMPPNSGNMNNNLQHKLKLLQQQGGAAPSMNNMSPTQVRGGALPGASTQNMVQQQAAQQQILQQLRLAVQSGLISPQLLNRQLPHNILVLLQQLLQLQNALQNLVQRQQFLQQNKVALSFPRPQLDQVSAMINQYKTQILNLQKQLQAAQQSQLMKQPPSAPTPTPQQMQAMSQPSMSVPPPMTAPMHGEGGDSMLSLPGDTNGGAGNASMSRLNQWKQLTPEREGQADLNRAPGTKPQEDPQSSPNMGPFGDLTSLNITGDTTWSTMATSGTSNWPSAPGDASGDGKADDGNTQTSSLASMLDGSGNLGLSTDVIPEFVPGKPWQGLSSKSVEDDPHITPGSISRSLSVNVVKDDYLNNLAANKPTLSFADSTKGMGKLGISAAESSMANALTQGASNLQAQQAGNHMGTSQWQGFGGFGRQHSWAGRSPGSAFTQVSGSGWDGRQSSSWLLKNLSQVDEQ